MLGELERLSDKELDLLLSELEYRTRSAIAVGDSAIIHRLVEEYVRAEEEAARRFRAWAEHHAASPSSAGGSAPPKEAPSARATPLGKPAGANGAGSSHLPGAERLGNRSHARQNVDTSGENEGQDAGAQARLHPDGRQQPRGRSGAHESPKAQAADWEKEQHPGGAPARADGHATALAQLSEQRRRPHRANRPRTPDRCAEDGVRWLRPYKMRPALGVDGWTADPECPTATAGHSLAGILPAAQMASRRLDGDAGPMSQNLSLRVPRRRLEPDRKRRAASARVEPVRLMGDEGSGGRRPGSEGYLTLQDPDREPGEEIEGDQHHPAVRGLAGHRRDGDRANTGSDTRGPARPWPVGLSPALPPEVCSVDHCDATAGECERSRQRCADVASGLRPGRPRVWGGGAFGVGPAARRAATVTLSISPEAAGRRSISLVVRLVG